MERPEPKASSPSLRDDDRRAVVALDDARGGDADDAAVPAFAIDHDAVGLAECGIAGDALFDRAQNAALFFLAFGIETIKFRQQVAGRDRDLSR